MGPVTSLYWLLLYKLHVISFYWVTEQVHLKCSVIYFKKTAYRNKWNTSYFISRLTSCPLYPLRTKIKYPLTWMFCYVGIFIEVFYLKILTIHFTISMSIKSAVLHFKPSYNTCLHNFSLDISLSTVMQEEVDTRKFILNWAKGKNWSKLTKDFSPISCDAIHSFNSSNSCILCCI